MFTRCFRKKCSRIGLVCTWAPTKPSLTATFRHISQHFLWCLWTTYPSRMSFRIRRNKLAVKNHA